MTLLTVVRGVCAVVGVAMPTTVFSGITGNRTMQEMLELANEMAQRIAGDARDWTRLRKMAILTGDGAPGDDGLWYGTTEFALPSDFKRLLSTSNVWRSTSTQQPMRFILDTDEWINRRVRNILADAWGEWTMIGGKIHIWPVLRGPVDGNTAETAYFAYLDRNCVALASGGFSDSFLSDNDSFVLDERLLKLGMIWQWKANKGASYAEDMGTYGDALTTLQGNDSPAPIIVGGRLASNVDRQNAGYIWR